MAVYFATKAYVLSFTEALHEEVRAHGIHVTALCPGPVATEFAEVAGFGKAQAFNKLGASSAEVVAAGLAALDRNQAIIVPGVVNKVAAQSQRFLPRALIRRVVGSVKI